MSYTNGLDKPSDYFNTVLYTGDGSNGQAITGVGFQPDWLWIKSRSGTAFHELHDSVRGAGKRLFSNDTAGESNVGTVSSFDSDGFTVSRNNAYDGTNQSGVSFVGWNWLASNTTASNTDGSITSTVSANTTSGFSIVSYTGTGSNATIGHGLGSAPKVVIVKTRDAARDWTVYHGGISNMASGYIILNATDAFSTAFSTIWNNTDPTSSVFSVGTANTSNNLNSNYIAYCFAEKKGFSKFGSYTGNGNYSDGTFVYTGFKPAWIMVKRTDTAGAYWTVMDSVRSPYNEISRQLYPSVSDAEYDNPPNNADFLSNGFKLYHGSTPSPDNTNASGGTYIYMAFAENPFVTSSGIPTTAR